MVLNHFSRVRSERGNERWRYVGQDFHEEKNRMKGAESIHLLRRRILDKAKAYQSQK